ncbi:MAG: oxygen-dependent coproporphyrinogen oxidase [Bacteroidia bacterium]
MLTKEKISQRFLQLQDSICTALENEDGKAKFMEDNWIREEGGGGRTRIIQNGSVIEKGGVLYSAVHGPVPDFLTQESAPAANASVSTTTFYATGVSIVIHPENPMVPIIHMNVRYFEMSNGTWWFGGGIDLTPHYVNEEDAAFFHSALKNTCDRFDASLYKKYKEWADDYFFITHRKETRGVGGIFFDKLNESSGFTKDQLFDFVIAVGETFAPVYTALMNRNKAKASAPENKQWQLLRRGRYVEFNLIYDKGTKFGLESNGRVESILMSLPKTAGWEYNFNPKAGSAEEKTLSLLKKGISWVK